MIRRSSLVIEIVAGLLTLAGFTWAQNLPPGPGQAETARLCRQCHELARVTSLRQDPDAWNSTMAKMKAYGMKATDQEYELVLRYLSKAFPAEEVRKVNVNTATPIELESGLTLRRSQSRAIIAYRKEHGPFKSLDDLKKVPLLDPDYIEEKKDKITFN